jgi:hypothetical protein
LGVNANKILLAKNEAILVVERLTDTKSAQNIHKIEGNIGANLPLHLEQAKQSRWANKRCGWWRMAITHSLEVI